MFGSLHHPRPATGNPLHDFGNVARRLYRPEKVDEAVTRLRADMSDGLPRPRTVRMPNPGKQALFGELLEVHTVDVDERGQPNGAIRIIRWSRGKGPPMLWSPRLDAVVAFPRSAIEAPIHELDDSDEAAVEAYRTWTKGREPFGKGLTEQPDPTMRYYGPAVCTLYASDKFAERGKPWTRPFLHHHDQGVACWVSHESENRSGIIAIMVRGGELRVTEDGLAG